LDERAIIQAVKNGESYRSVAQKHHTTDYQIKKICLKHNVHSAYIIIPEEKILNIIKKRKVATISEILTDLEMSSHVNLQRRLRRLLDKKKIKTAIISKNSIFRGYINKTLYFVSKKDLEEWIYSKLPKDLPTSLKKIITRRFHEIGIDLKLGQREYCNISLPKPEYLKLKEKAKKENLTIKELILKYTLGM